jgi:hypothetical protein
VKDATQIMPKKQTTLTPEEIQNRTLDGISLDAPLSPEEIKNRQAEKSALLARTTPEPEEPTLPVVAGGEKPLSIDALLRKLAVAGTPKVDAETRDRLRAEAQPHLTAIRSAMTEHGILRTKNLADVEAVALQDWPAIRAATPAKLVLIGRGYVDMAQRALARLYETSTRARATLLSQFGDSAPGRNDIDPVNAVGAAEAVEAMLQGDGWRHPGTGDVSQTYRRAVSHLEVWAKRSKDIAASARLAVEAFKAAKQHAAEILAGVVPRENTDGPALYMNPVP